MDKKQMADIDLAKKIKSFEDYNNLLKKEIRLLDKLYKKLDKRDVPVETEIKMVEIQKRIANLTTEIENKQLFINRFHTHGATK